ncbi:MAG: hypothetical protein CBC48_10380, partial [bacterium TMED88]
ARRHGNFKALQCLFWWILHSRLKVDVFKISLRPIDNGLQSDPSSHPGYEVKVVDPETLREACRDPEMDISTELAEAAIANGDVITGAFKNGRLVSYVFATNLSAPHDDYFSVRVPPKMRYGYKGYTLPEHRGRHLMYSMSHLRARNDIFIQRGCKQHMAFIGAWNLSSLRSNRRTSTNRLIGYAVNAYWGKRPVSFLTPRVKRTGFRFLAQNRIRNPDVDKTADQLPTGP